MDEEFGGGLCSALDVLGLAVPVDEDTHEFPEHSLVPALVKVELLDGATAADLATAAADRFLQQHNTKS